MEAPSMPDQKSCREWLVAIGTLALAAFALWQLSLLRESNDISRETAKKQLRAYVSVFSAQIAGIREAGPVKVRVTVKNSGQTPAYETKIHVDAWWEQPLPKPKPGSAV